jgi:hypothetical protein
LWHFDNREQEKSSKESSSAETYKRPPDAVVNDKAAALNGADQILLSANSARPLPAPASRPKRNETVDEGIGLPGSFELTNDEVLSLLQIQGFKIEKTETNLDPARYGGYIRDETSMVDSGYRVVHWVAKKTEK